MYKRHVALISPWKAFPITHIYYFLCSPHPAHSVSVLSLTATLPYSFLPYALVSSRCNELTTPAQKAVTEVFIKHTAIRKGAKDR